MALKDIIKRLSPGRRRYEPARDTVPFPILMGLGQTTGRRLAIKPTPKNLRHFSRTVYARRAINAIKGPVAMLDWEVAPIKDAKPSRELDRQIKVVSDCLAHPNRDDSFRSFIEAVVEDVLLGAGAAEVQVSGDPSRPLWLFPVDGLTIQIYPGWSGDPDEARYAQSFGFGSIVGQREPDILLRNDE